MSMPIQRLALLRHGRTEWNTGGRLQGSSDIPLDATGREQAADAVTRLAAAGLDLGRVLCSDLGRARETAEVIARGLQLPVPEDVVAFRERDYGPAEGLTLDEVIARWPAVGERAREQGWQPGDSLNDLLVPADVPGLESEASCADRAEAALASLIPQAGEPGPEILLVAHGTLIRYLVTRLTGADTPLLGNTDWLRIERSATGTWTILDA